MSSVFHIISEVRVELPSGNVQKRHTDLEPGLRVGFGCILNGASNWSWGRLQADGAESILKQGQRANYITVGHFNCWRSQRRRKREISEKQELNQ